MSTGGPAAAPAGAPVSIFEGQDRDGNTRLTFEEFVAMQPRRVRDTHTLEEMQQWFVDADENGDGTLSINEFFKWSLGKSTAINGASILEQAFKRYDKNQGGSLDAFEFKAMATMVKSNKVGQVGHVSAF